MIYSTTTKSSEHRNSPPILRSCTTGFVNGIWNDQKVRWFTVDSVNCVDGILVTWNEESFKVDSIEYSGQWTALLGTQAQTNLISCAVVGVCVRCSIRDG
ncbi:hypothetical protein NC653_024768 [Populus alba x Populus x berolinensis]|uniref:Uncharacterized protein n=1 Tax=Populus alba x Populus x berolinensis TaxID=444605 RepID=A0AAD6M9K9_9ROSI|nr:hypothetical protein NC653_024768 [Populus alba x Populus x berolinensis]